MANLDDEFQKDFFVEQAATQYDFVENLNY